MSWFGNRSRETKEVENPEVKPRNQILQTPEKSTSEAKGKLDASERENVKKPSWELSPDKKAELNKGERELAEKFKHKQNEGTASEGDPTKGQRKLERGQETERE